ncbi:Nn.00g015000.m01.CDS01 [Neocucurbitaria sp. VM-36]
MANIATPTQRSESTQLTKPADWALYLVTAALKFSSDTSPSIGYLTPDEGRLDILKTLNWYEAHDEYEWPDFSTMSYDFNQAMRFRRALVNDVFIALQKAGYIKDQADPGASAPPNSVRADHSVKRTATTGGRRMKERKRRCQREDTSDTIGPTAAFWETDEFLANTMRLLIEDSASSAGEVFGNSAREGDAERDFANHVYDMIIEQGNRPHVLEDVL